MRRAEELIEDFEKAEFDEIDSAMSAIQNALRNNDDKLAIALTQYITNEEKPVWMRALALETFAAARADNFSELVMKCIKYCLSSLLSDLRFAALVAVTDLPKADRKTLKEHILNTAIDGDEDIKRFKPVLQSSIDKEIDVDIQEIRWLIEEKELLTGAIQCLYHNLIKKGWTAQQIAYAAGISQKQMKIWAEDPI